MNCKLIEFFILLEEIAWLFKWESQSSILGFFESPYVVMLNHFNHKYLVKFAIA